MDNTMFAQDGKNISNNVCARDFLNPVLEGFDGVKKHNARKIFGILLIIIVIDFAMDIIM